MNVTLKIQAARKWQSWCTPNASSWPYYEVQINYDLIRYNFLKKWPNRQQIIEELTWNVDKSAIINKPDLVYVIDDNKRITAVHIDFIFKKPCFLGDANSKLLLGLHNPKYFEMTDVGEKHTAIISPGCYSKTKSICVLFILYQPLFQYLIDSLT